MSKENVEIVRRLYASWERGDLRTADFFDVEIQHSRIGSELPGLDGDCRRFERFAVAMADYVERRSSLESRCRVKGSPVAS